ncbi:RES family NAD+ phosphorylase [Acinetobacter sp. ANC 3882]|uniref:RES family NAD+ phosphorylase n=1 Tax=Acinetobacter sp. ANC 3882 TaxID=2923423 RepID=UPI001F4AFB55|nr:RES family NAD+ phosphorylase [Acinetobacter sp. ANC 3882]MCH7313999.1 RES family NAD+ phosphorylase [Acinetobacter sp. ANC 3882]
MAHRCCSNCFSDKSLKAKINAIGRIQRCFYCKTNENSSIDIDQLYPLIQPLIEVIIQNYPETNEGLTITEILDQEFSLFNTSNCIPLINDALSTNQNNLLLKRFAPVSKNLPSEWKELKEELMHNNRFFPQTQLYQDAFLERGNLFEIFTNVIEDLNYEINTSDELFRARISDKPLIHSEMLKPPIEVVSIGRANPDGISYLYVAENIDTCLSEVRPSNGQTIYIALFKPIVDFNVLDLRNPRKDISFLSLAENDDNDDFKKFLKLINLLEEFSKELSLPVLPNRSRIDYIPTQFITEFFKNIGILSGLMFNSSFGKGYNVVVFNQDLMSCLSTEIKIYKVKGIDLHYE